MLFPFHTKLLLKIFFKVDIDRTYFQIEFQISFPWHSISSFFSLYLKYEVFQIDYYITLLGNWTPNMFRGPISDTGEN